MSISSAPCCQPANVGKLSLRLQRTVESFSLVDLFDRLSKAGTGESQDRTLRDAARGGEGQGRAIVDADSE